MNLEEAIKQKNPFRNSWHRGAVNLIYTHNWMLAKHKEMFKPHGITLQQYNVLRILRGQYPEPISTSNIRDRMLDRMSDVSRIVDRLVRKHLVARKVCQDDKRLVDVVITEDGLQLLKQLDEVANQIDNLLGNLDEAEMDELNRLLDKIRDNQE